MAQDPYGFQPAADTAPAHPAATAMWLGVGSIMLASVGMCFCYLPYFVALPLGVAAIWHGSRSLRGPVDGSARSMATAGMMSGILGSLLSGAFLMFIAFYVAIYLVIGAVALVGAATQH